ncbi:alpha/beta-hydrolase [Linderina pennispora]|uniref:Alpha/beta-hydrolase n=1 Tax=Linderina pennispora TaxID=61395 RepID=A0A1Y1WAV6_9FUNG|nr:alpha/beta-hydrolase [Linderina pennispora]ORX70661.1 alpha/beta-hydrolase [Linderina pennispora]
MLEHILGKPSANVRRMQVLAITAMAMSLLKRKTTPWCLRWTERIRFPLWKALVLYSAVLYALDHMGDIFGLNAPEPLREYYSRSFYRTTWVFTALDAGFWTAMSIRPKPLRDVLSMVFSLYYLVFTARGVEKVRKVRALVTIDHLRVAWNKGADNPILRFMRYLHSSKLTIDREEPAKCHIYYAGNPSEYSETRYIVLNYPGGGATSDYLSRWAERTNAVIVSVDYAKAPEYPYPYAIDQCYEVYKDIVASNGRCIGIHTHEPLKIVLAGDSAGGNITAGVMFKILESPDRLRKPDGIVFIYGCFNVDIRAWMTKDEARILLGSREADILVEPRDHLHHESPLATTNKDNGYQQSRFQIRKRKLIDERIKVVRADDSDSGEPIGYTPLAMTSAFTYFNDQVLTPEMMRAMVIMYVGPNARPDFRTDYYLSPIVAPDHLLEQFPPVYFMCGEKDPMVDDTVLFAERIRRAKTKDTGAPEDKAVPGDHSDHHEYQAYRGSRLYTRRHSQPRILQPNSKSFYIGSTDTSDDEGLAQAKFPASLRMSGMPEKLSVALAKSISGRNATEGKQPVIKIKLVAGMSHGFMQMYALLPESKQVANTLGDWLMELLYGSHHISMSSRCTSQVETGIFEKGIIDKHGIEVVSSANMVKRRGLGLADPLN